MPQNTSFLYANLKRGLAAPGVLKAKPGVVVSVVCLAPGTIDLIDDVTSGGAGASIEGFPATMTRGQVLPLNSPASVGISASAVSGSYNVAFS
jgi:hypothetical protein